MDRSHLEAFYQMEWCGWVGEWVGEWVGGWVNLCYDVQITLRFISSFSPSSFFRYGFVHAAYTALAHKHRP